MAVLRAGLLAVDGEEVCSALLGPNQACWWKMEKTLRVTLLKVSAGPQWRPHTECPYL